jgi:hypothetical protein
MVNVMAIANNTANAPNAIRSHVPNRLIWTLLPSKAARIPITDGIAMVPFGSL